MNINYNFRSPNYSDRCGLITFIIIHFTEINFKESLERLCDPKTKVSAHYIIKENGEIFNLVDDTHCAWHAGNSYWKGIERLNEYSIGIEFDNSGMCDFTQKQMLACIDLCQHLKTLYNIQTQNIIGHSDIAPDRKIDPGIFFDWAYFAKFNLGIWHNVDMSAISNEISTLLEFGADNIETFRLQTNLRKLGYKIETTGIFDLQTNYVVRAFQSHFQPEFLQQLGKDLYWNPNSKYSWNSTSELIISDLIQVITNLES